MPPVRWKLSAVTLVCLLHVAHTKAQHRQEEISLDGWKPIVGTRKPNYFEPFNRDHGDLYKYEVYSTPPPTVTALPPTGTAGPSRNPFYRGSPKPPYISGRKIPHQKHSPPDPYYALPSNEYRGPHIPLGAVVHTRPSQIGHIKQHASASTIRPFIQYDTTIKPFAQHVTTGKPPFMQYQATNKRTNKPTRTPTPTNDYRDDIFTAAASSGNYNFYKPGPSGAPVNPRPPNKNIRARETIDLGLPGTNHYSINQPHAHIQFTNRFALPSTSDSVFQQYNNPDIQAFIFGKHPQSNDINYQIQSQNEDFTRNLIPPPQLYKNKDPLTVNRGKPNVHENVVLQVPPPFQYTSQKNEPQVQVQVTKEKLQEFHNNIPQNFHSQYIEYDFSGIRRPTEASKPIYEVTESEVWQKPSLRPSISSTVRPKVQRPARTRKPSQRRPQVIEEDPPVFLPTPYKPEDKRLEPTSPTQSEVSTIFSKLSKLQKEKEVITTPNPFSFSVKEVSTHYPVFGKPIFGDPHTSKEVSNEITTLQEEELTTTTQEPQRVRPQRRRRPDSRRTTTTTTTTESPEEFYYNVQKEEEPVETERPVRIRRPNRYRTTTPTTTSEEVPVKTNRGRNRFRNRTPDIINYESTRTRQRPSRVETTTTLPENHKSEEDYYRESQEAASEKSEEIEDTPKPIELVIPGRHFISDSKQEQGTIKPFIILTTTEKLPTTNLVLPENEEEATTILNLEDLTTTPPTTTTSHPNRIKARPFKFDNSNRPRFSVKDFRHKLSTTTTTTESYHRTTESSRIRMPNRLRRPLTNNINNEEDSTEPVRTKFVPKDARHAVSTEASSTSIITEKNVKSVNTRLRPFGRYKTTTPATTAAPKISIKPNLFSRKRPPMISLRSKIYNKLHKNNTEPVTEKAVTTESNDIPETTEYEHEVESEPVTESTWNNIKSTEESLDDTTALPDISNVEVDPFFYSQRVSDLTSSAKNEYNTPGLFKSVSPTSRRIPNYFTIATDDPILPIEAFFPNIKEKMREKDS